MQASYFRLRFARNLEWKVLCWKNFPLVHEQTHFLVPLCGNNPDQSGIFSIETSRPDHGFRHRRPLGMQQYVWLLVPQTGTNCPKFGHLLMACLFWVLRCVSLFEAECVNTATLLCCFNLSSVKHSWEIELFLSAQISGVNRSLLKVTIVKHFSLVARCHSFRSCLVHQIS